MRICPLLLAAALLAACGGQESRPQEPSSVQARTSAADRGGGRYGIELAVPGDWHAEHARGTVRFANRPLPELELCAGPRRLERGDVVVEILERNPPADEQGFFPRLDRPLQLRAADFRLSEPGVVPEGHGHANVPFSLEGRFFVLFAESGARAVDPRVVKAANRILASLRVQPGDFYPGEVEPPTFQPSPGWHTGSSGPRPVAADGEWAVAYASTVPYRDTWEAVPMQETLEALPPDGIAVHVALSRWCDPNDPRQRWPAHHRPYRLTDFEILPGWEGQIRDLPQYRLWTRVPGQYEVELRIYFGSPDPTGDMLERAQAELHRLRLPEWGPWEPK